MQANCWSMLNFILTWIHCYSSRCLIHNWHGFVQSQLWSFSLAHVLFSCPCSLFSCPVFLPDILIKPTNDEMNWSRTSCHALFSYIYLRQHFIIPLFHPTDIRSLILSILVSLLASLTTR